MARKRGQKRRKEGLRAVGDGDKLIRSSLANHDASCDQRQGPLGYVRLGRPIERFSMHLGGECGVICGELPLPRATATASLTPL